MDMQKEAIKKAALFCWMLSNLLASVDVIEFQTRGVFRLRYN
jgi:hypothetical protein